MGGKRKGGAQGGDRDSKQKKWAPQRKGPVIPAGSRGCLVSCVAGKEHLAGREAIELLKQYLGDGDAAAAAAKPSGSGGDISALIAEEVAELKDKRSQPLQTIKTGIHGLLYLSMNASDGATPDPVGLVTRMAEDIKQSKQCKSRLCLRFIPVEHVCNPNMEDIKKLAAEVVPKAMPPRDDAETPETFAVLYEHRASVNLDRMTVINAFVNNVPKGYKVSLDNAQHTIIVQLIKTCCAISIVQRYRELSKFNIRELSGFGESADQKAKAKDKAKKAAENAPKDVAAEAPANAQETAAGSSGGGDTAARSADAAAAPTDNAEPAAEPASAQPADTAQRSAAVAQLTEAEVADEPDTAAKAGDACKSPE